MTLDLSTIANFASVLCLPGALIGAIVLLLGLFETGREFMEKHPKSLQVGILLLVLLALFDIAAHSGLLSNNGLETVFNQAYTNKTVAIDNKEFYNCTFENVTLRFDGGPFKLEKVRFIGSVRVETPNRAADRMMVLMHALYHAAESTQINLENEEIEITEAPYTED